MYEKGRRVGSVRVKNKSQFLLSLYFFPIRILLFINFLFQLLTLVDRVIEWHGVEWKNSQCEISGANSFFFHLFRVFCWKTKVTLYVFFIYLLKWRRARRGPANFLGPGNGRERNRKQIVRAFVSLPLGWTSEGLRSNTSDVKWFFFCNFSDFSLLVPSVALRLDFRHCVLFLLSSKHERLSTGIFLFSRSFIAASYFHS